MKTIEKYGSGLPTAWEIAKIALILALLCLFARAFGSGPEDPLKTGTLSEKMIAETEIDVPEEIPCLEKWMFCPFLVDRNFCDTAFLPQQLRVRGLEDRMLKPCKAPRFKSLSQALDSLPARIGPRMKTASAMVALNGK